MSEQYDVQEEQAVDEKRASVKRRGLIAGAAALVATALASKTMQDVSAANGSPVLIGGDGGGSGAAQSGSGMTWLTINPTPAGGNPAFRTTLAFGGVPDAHPDGIQGIAVNPNPTVSNAGVFGRVNELNGVGIFGAAPNGTGAFGDSSSGSGVAGNSDTGAGLYGLSASGNGIYAQSTSGVAGNFLSTSNYGIVAVTTAGRPFSALTGRADTDGGTAFAGGTSNPNAFAAFFSGAVVIDGSFTVVNPANKHGAIKAADGQHHLLYSMESPESWLEDFGTAKFTNGTVNVNLNADFAGVVHTSDYHVFLTEVDGHHHLTVHNKTATGFTVQADPEIAALKGKTAADLSGSVAWRVVARPQTDLKAERFAKFDLPQTKIPGVNDLPKPPKQPKPRR